jgi:hypothetical protein
MSPLAVCFTDRELQIVFDAARPLPVDRRDEFLQELRMKIKKLSRYFSCCFLEPAPLPSRGTCRMNTGVVALIASPSFQAPTTHENKTTSSKITS